MRDTKSNSEGRSLASMIDQGKKYPVTYLAPCQSPTEEVEYGVFDLYGRDLTEKQIIHLYETGFISNK